MKRFNKSLIVFFVVILMFFMVACSSNTDNNDGDVSQEPAETVYPLTVTDDLGNEVTFESTPEKVVSVSPGHTEILFALELGDKIVGRDSYSTFPAEAEEIEIVGDYSGPNTEAIINAAPDVLFAFPSVPDDIKVLLEGAGIKVMVFNPSNIDGVLDNIATYGKIFDVQDKATALVAEMQTKREEIVAKTEGLEEPSVFIDISPGFWSVGPNTFIGSIVEELGGNNIAGDAETDYPQLSLEKIIEVNPEVYISTGTPMEDLQAVDGLDTINAFKNDNVTVIPWGTVENDIVQRPGPRIIDGLEVYAKAMYPDVFE